MDCPWRRDYGDHWYHEHAFATVRGNDPVQLEELAERHSRLLHTVLYLPHPQDDYATWRKRWGQVSDAVTELNRLISLSG